MNGEVPARRVARPAFTPSLAHFRAAVRALIYLRGTAQRSLTFTPNVDRHLETYVDSSWATKFSCSGAMYFYHGCLVHWFSKMQRSVTLSSAEAEYFGAMLASRDLVFLRELLVELAVSLNGPSPIYCDSIEPRFPGFVRFPPGAVMISSWFLQGFVRPEPPRFVDSV